MKKYTFLPEASSKMLLRHIREVEQCATVIINNYFKTVKNMQVTILKLVLDSAASTEETFSFLILTSTHTNEKLWNVSIPIKAFDTCNEEWTDNINFVEH